MLSEPRALQLLADVDAPMQLLGFTARLRANHPSACPAAVCDTLETLTDRGWASITGEHPRHAVICITDAGRRHLHAQKPAPAQMKPAGPVPRPADGPRRGPLPLGIRDRLRDLLRAGPMSRRRIGAQLADLSSQQISQQLYSGKRAGIFTRLPDHRWQLTGATVSQAKHPNQLQVARGALRQLLNQLQPGADLGALRAEIRAVLAIVDPQT